MGWVLQVNFLAGAGNTQRHLLIPVKLIDVVPMLVYRLLDAVVHELGLEHPSLFDII